MTMRMRKPGKENPQNIIQRQPLPFIRHRGEFVPIETIRQHERKIVEREGYKVKLVEPVFRGFKVDVIAPDGRELAKDLVVRKWFSKKVRDPHVERDVTISVHLASGFSPHISVSPIVIKSPEGIPSAIGLLSSEDEGERMNGAYALLDAARARSMDISPAIPALAKALADSCIHVRINAAGALIHAAEMGTDISDAVGGLKAALQDEKKVRANASIALALHFERTQDAKIPEAFAAHPDQEVRKYGEYLSEFCAFKPLHEGPYR